MKEPRELYEQSHRADLRDTYPSFYLALTNFISSLPKRWFFMNCYNIDYDGSRFSIEFHDGYDHRLYATATKAGPTYKFVITKQTDQ